MESRSTVVNDGDDALIGLPPGFRFHPTDEEIVTHYLTPKVINRNFTANAIGEVDLNKCEPWDLHKKAKMGEKEWYFFCQRDRKYPTGMRTNRATDSGYWKATGKDKEIKRNRKSGGGGKLVGMKKTLVFYKGRAPKGEKSNWVMHEFRLEGDFSYYNMSRASKDEWVVCRIVQKNAEVIKNPILNTGHGMTRMNSFADGLLDGSPWLPPLMESPAPRSDMDRPGSSFTHSDKNNITNTNSESYVASQSQVPQNDKDYKNFIVSSYDNFDVDSFLVSPFTDDHQSDVTFGTHVPYPSFESTRYTDWASVLEGDNEKAVGQCKVEPYVTNTTHQSSKISVSSQDTGISTDMTTETSSASIHNIYGYKSL